MYAFFVSFFILRYARAMSSLSTSFRISCALRNSYYWVSWILGGVERAYTRTAWARAVAGGATICKPGNGEKLNKYLIRCKMTRETAAWGSAVALRKKKTDRSIGRRADEVWWGHEWDGARRPARPLSPRNASVTYIRGAPPCVWIMYNRMRHSNATTDRRESRDRRSKCL